MDNLQKANRLSGFFMQKKEEEMKTLFTEFCEQLKRSMDLPPDIRLTGVQFDWVDGGKELLECPKVCYAWVNGQLLVYCCQS